MKLLTKKTKLMNGIVVVEEIIKTKSVFFKGAFNFYHSIEIKKGREILGTTECRLDEKTALKIIKENK